MIDRSYKGSGSIITCLTFTKKIAIHFTLRLWDRMGRTLEGEMTMSLKGRELFEHCVFCF